jgi:ectoine hydroxylase-related dioxygenase (phytanoyl-CoA dioxygenase family)
MVVSRLTEPAKTRKSLPLTEKDLADIARLREEIPQREALSEMVGFVVVESVAEAALLRMIFEAGLRAIHEKAEERAYASAAEDRLASGEADETRRIARRRRPDWANQD